MNKLDTLTVIFEFEVVRGELTKANRSNIETEIRGMLGDDVSAIGRFYIDDPGQEVTIAVTANVQD